jgi:hypothetical protein
MDRDEPSLPSTALSAEAQRDARSRRTRLIVGRTVTGVLFALVLLVGWVGVRGFLAKQALESAMPDARLVQSSIAAGDIRSAAAAAADLTDHARTAAALTDDPIWRAAEAVPGAGPNLAAVRETAGAAQVLAAQVVQPLIGVAEQVDPAHLKPVGGAVDLTPITAAQPKVLSAQNAFHRAEASVKGIDRSGVIGPVRSAIARLESMLGQAGPGVDALGNTARLLPSMLGADGPRSYLLLVQNPAELRSTGGLVGALALITADHGKVTLTTQSSGTSIEPTDAPVTAIPASTQGLYGPLIGRYVQDVNLTPDFPLAASTASAMWKVKYGGTIDGVLALDPVALTHLLGATGAVELPTGDALTPQNAVQLLLSEVYARWVDPDQQDAFFASAAGAVFEKVASGDADGTALVKALALSGTERRLLMWSAHPEEQKVLASTTLAGSLPRSTGQNAALGVYFNDATGSKMDYYLKTQVQAGAAVCRSDGIPSSRVTVTLTNVAPADAAWTLPAYVTGGGWAGVAPGNIKTRVAVYGPEGGLLARTSSGGADYSAVTGTDAGRPVSVFTVELAPGESKTVSVDLLNQQQNGPGMTVAVTPTLAGAVPELGASPDATIVAGACADALK